MKTSHLIFSFLLASSINADAYSATSPTNVDEDFKLCATTALKKQNMKLKKVTVDNSQVDSRYLDHDRYSSARRYKMRLANKVGKALGTVTCMFDRSGQLESANFVSKL